MGLQRVGHKSVTEQPLRLGEREEWQVRSEKVNRSKATAFISATVKNGNNPHVHQLMDGYTNCSASIQRDVVEQ